MIKDRKYSKNFKISRDLIRKRRQIDDNVNFSSEILFLFLYKYLSDTLKEYLNNLIEDKEISFKEIYKSERYDDDFEKKSLNELGYFFTIPEMFIDELITNNYDSSYLDRIVFEAFKEGIEFNKGSKAEEYFNLFFNDYSGRLYYNSIPDDRDLLMRDFILSISKLDVFEEEFKYSQVFDAIANTGIVGAMGTPEYIYDILVSLVLKTKYDISSVYNPFLQDGSSLACLSNNAHVDIFYGKENNHINFLTSIVNMIINGVNFENIFFFNENAVDSVAIENKSFDVIISKVPNRFRDYPSKYRKQNIEFSSRRELELKETMLSNLEMSHNELNEKMDRLLNDIISEKMAIDGFSNSEFIGEYESLMDNDFLFIINMINSLKDDGIMAVSISQNFLFKNSQKIMRKFLTYENNYLDAVISLPKELGRNIRPEVILVFRKNKNIGDVLFIDPSRSYSTKTSNNRIPGSFRKYLLFDDESKQEIIDCYSKRETIDKFSNLISIDEICENEFNLSISRYVDTYDGEFVDLKDLAVEKKEIDKEMKSLNSKIMKNLYIENI